jgi:soluble P-type ATPase
LTIDDAIFFGNARTDKAILGVGLWFNWDAMRQAMLVICNIQKEGKKEKDRKNARKSIRRCATITCKTCKNLLL